MPRHNEFSASRFFPFYRSWIDSVLAITDEEAGILIKTICLYDKSGIVPEPVADRTDSRCFPYILFSGWKGSLDSAKEHYATVGKNRGNRNREEPEEEQKEETQRIQETNPNVPKVPNENKSTEMKEKKMNENKLMERKGSGKEGSEEKPISVYDASFILQLAFADVNMLAELPIFKERFKNTRCTSREWEQLVNEWIEERKRDRHA